jgi:hypothetical protein
MTHQRETVRDRRLRTVRRAGSARLLALLAGTGAALGLAHGASAQVTRSFTSSQSVLWAQPENWTPWGVPTPVDRVRFGLGGGERLVLLPETGETTVRMLTVAPQTGGGTAEYRFDLAEGVLRTTALNVPSLIVGQGGATGLATLALQRGDVQAGTVWVSVLAPGRLRVESGEAGYARLFCDELLLGGTVAGQAVVDGEVQVRAGRLAGDARVARGELTVSNGGLLDVDGRLTLGVDAVGLNFPASLTITEFSTATVGELVMGPLATVSTRALVLDPALRGGTPALGVVGMFDVNSSAQFAIGDALIQRPGATLTLSAFAGESPFGVIPGRVELAGTLVLSFAPGFDPALGSSFPLLTTQGPLTGRWTVSYLPGLTGGRFLTIDYPPRSSGALSVVLGVDDLDQILDFDDPQDGITIPSGPTAAVMGDFNGDGRPDVAIAFADPDEPTTAPGSVAILLNRGVDETGWLGFDQQILLTVIADPRAIDVADFDLDGDTDLIVAGYTSRAVQVIENRGTAGYSVRPQVGLTSGAVDVATGDLNQDGRPDVVCALPDIESVVELMNQLRTFDLVPRPPKFIGLSVGAVNPFDPDADKDSDVGGAGGSSSRAVSGSAFVTINDGTGTLGDAALTQVGDGPVDIATGDLDGDGFPEMVTVDLASNTLSVLVNDGAGAFAQAFALPVGGQPRSIVVSDLDGDNDLDIAIVADTSAGRALQVIRNDTQSPGDLVFAPVVDVQAGPQPSIVLSADLNGDARNDLLAINPLGPRGIDGGQVTVLLSKSGPRCAADFTGNGVVTEDDLNAFIAAWFRDLELGSFISDFNRDSVVNSTDVSDYINAYFAADESCRG